MNFILPFYYFFWFTFWDTVSLCNLGWLGTSYVNQIGLELNSDPPASASWVRSLKVCITVLGYILILKSWCSSFFSVAEINNITRSTLGMREFTWLIHLRSHTVHHWGNVRTGSQGRHLKSRTEADFMRCHGSFSCLQKPGPPAQGQHPPQLAGLFHIKN